MSCTLNCSCIESESDSTFVEKLTLTDPNLKWCIQMMINLMIRHILDLVVYAPESWPCDWLDMNSYMLAHIASYSSTTCTSKLPTPWSCNGYQTEDLINLIILETRRKEYFQRWIKCMYCNFGINIIHVGIEQTELLKKILIWMCPYRSTMVDTFL